MIGPVALLLLLAAAPPTGGTSAAAAPPSSEVVVVAPRPLSPDRQVEAVGEVNRSTGQMARWPHAVCVAARGASEPVDAYVADTIARTARSLHLPPPASPCEPNVLIAFTTDPAAVWAKLTAGKALHDADDRVTPPPTDLGAPVTWLRTEEEMPADGSPWIWVEVDPVTHRSVKGQRYAKDTRIGTSVKTDATRLIVVVDAKQIAGIKVSAVAAYLTMVALAPVKASAPRLDAASALNLFRRTKADEAAEPGLTAWDRAYLQGLYTAAPGALARDQQQRIRETLTHAALR